MHVEMAGETLVINQARVSPPRPGADRYDYSKLDERLSAVPYYTTLRSQGLPMRAAADSFLSYRDRAITAAHHLYQQSLPLYGMQAASDAALTILETRGLTYLRGGEHEPSISGDRLEVSFVGIPVEYGMDFGPIVPSDPYATERRSIWQISALESMLAEADSSLIIISRGVLVPYTGKAARQVKRQLLWVEEHQSVEGLPDGPLQPNEQIFQEVLEGRGVR
jgi:hypothetical protein